MSNPQQPELARSRKTPAQDQDAVAAVVEGQRQPETSGPTGPVPAANQPGHHPAEEQDKPDIDAFAQKAGTMDPAEREEREDAVAGTGGRAVSTRVVALALAALAVALAVVAERRRRARR